MFEFALLPVWALFFGLVAIVVGDLVKPAPARSYRLAVLACGVSTAGSIIAALQPTPEVYPPLARVLALDPMGHVFAGLATGLALLAVGIAQDSFREEQTSSGEFYTLLLAATLGAVLVAHTQDILLLFIAFEMLSIPLYMVAGFRRYKRASAEAGLKYFLSGAVASAFFLFGASWIFGATGSTAYADIPSALLLHAQPLLFALLMILAAFAFKLSAAPFHMWAPDTYQGAPVPVATFISTVPKAAMVGATLRLLFVAAPPFALEITIVLSALAVLSIIIGNAVALTQTDLPRLLAYSGVAQIGYLLIGLSVLTSTMYSADYSLAVEALGAVIFYLLVYTVTNVALWTVVLMVSKSKGSTEFSAFDGLSQTSPGMALALLFGTLSLAGLPPLAGFVGKVALFRVALTVQPLLAILGVLGSVVSLYYYFQILKRCYINPPSENAHPVLLSPSYRALLTIMLALSVVGGLYPGVANAALSLSERIFEYL